MFISHIAQNEITHAHRTDRRDAPHHSFGGHVNNSGQC